MYDAARSSTVVPLSLAARDRASAAGAAWPGAVEMILSALEVAGGAKTREQRNFGRRRYRVRAALRLHSDPDGAPSWILYTRDANARGLGFLTPHLLPLGYGGVIHLESPARAHVSVACTLLRCREISKGWYEGSLYFNRERNDFVVGG
ncbi:MAG: hypothetical protein H0T11_00320 [Chthoniobacterales bacterium]|nr:hypothetical protein [Chthoniobacterales bacterium]